MKGVLKRVKTNLSRRYPAVAEADERQVTKVHLEFLDDAKPGSADEGEYDPYNSGSFDRSNMWKSRSRTYAHFLA